MAEVKITRKPDFKPEQEVDYEVKTFRPYIEPSQVPIIDYLADIHTKETGKVWTRTDVVNAFLKQYLRLGGLIDFNTGIEIELPPEFDYPLNIRKLRAASPELAAAAESREVTIEDTFREKVDLSAFKNEGEINTHLTRLINDLTKNVEPKAAKEEQVRRLLNVKNELIKAFKQKNPA